MEPSNPNAPTDTPATSPNPEMPQPLNTSNPVIPDTSGTNISLGGGLPPQMPGNPQVNPSSGGGKKMMIIIIAVLVLAILGVGVYYFYMQYGKKSPQPETQTTQSTQELNNLQTEVESIEVTDPAADLVEVDKEINLLEATPSASGR